MQTPGSKEPQRIAKLLARAGVASRREIERMIGEGRVALDGTPLATPATLVASLHGVTVDGQPVQAPAPARLFLFHKPPGVLTAANDPRGRRTIYDVLPKDLPRLIPVGRLDLNTEGLLLLTTDGELKRQLELPSTGVERAYRARAYGQVTQAQLEELMDGIEIEGVRYGPIDANLERRTGANVWVEMTLREGKNREVRRVLEHLGLQVSRLIRVRYGPFILADMPAGSVGEVRQYDLVAFRRSLEKGGRQADPITVKTAPPVGRRPAEPSADAPAPRPARQRTPRDEMAPRAPRPAAPRKHEVREEIDTKARRITPRAAAASPRAERDGAPSRTPAAAVGPRGGRSQRQRAPREEAVAREPVAERRPTRTDTPPATDAPRAPRPPRPERKPGWARAKPKPGPKSRPRGRK